MLRNCVCGCKKAYSIRGCKKAYSNWLQNSMHIKDCRMALLQNNMLTLKTLHSATFIQNFFKNGLFTT